MSEEPEVLKGVQANKCPECGGHGIINKAVPRHAFGMPGQSSDWTTAAFRCWRCKGDGAARALGADVKTCHITPPRAEDVLTRQEPFTSDDLVDAVLACAEEELLGRLSGLSNGFDSDRAQVMFGRAKGVAVSLRLVEEADCKADTTASEAQEAAAHLSPESVGEIVRFINQQHAEAAKETPWNRDYMRALRRLSRGVESALAFYRKNHEQKSDETKP